MEQIVTTLANYGAMGICLLYFMYITNKTLEKTNEAINNNNMLIQKLIDREEKQS